MSELLVANIMEYTEHSTEAKELNNFHSRTISVRTMGTDFEYLTRL